jgi:hypothetical protein
VFREDGRQCQLRPGRLDEIRAYLIGGTPHLCHHAPENRFACRGGRDYQLMIWHRLGMISAPTDGALAEAMRGLGLEPPRK